MYAHNRFSLSDISFISSFFSFVLFFSFYFSARWLSVHPPLSVSDLLFPLFSFVDTPPPHPSALCHKQRRWWLFLPDWVWKCAMINMLLWLLISSNGSVKLQWLDKCWRWSNVCGATQRHNEGKQLEFIGYKSMKAAVVFGHKSRIRSIL